MAKFRTGTCLLFLLSLGALGCAEGKVMLDPLQSALADYLPREGLVASFGLNEKDGLVARDSTPNQNDGALTTPTLWRPLLGHSAGALELDGSAVVMVKDSDSLHLQGEMAVSCWLQVAAASFDGSEQAILAKGSGWSLYRSPEGPFVGLRVGAESLLGKTAIDDGQWHHLVGVHTGTRLFLYYDGQLEAQRPSSGPLDPSEGDLWIGGNPAQPEGRRYLGLIDDVLVYARALGPAEVQAITRSGPGVDPDGASPSLDLRRVLLKGAVADASGVAQLTLNGQPLAVQPDGTWEIPVDLTRVDSEWTLEALDVYGNSTKSTFAVHLELPRVPAGEEASR